MTAIVVISAGLCVPSSTRLLADQLAAATAAAVGRTPRSWSCATWPTRSPTTCSPGSPRALAGRSKPSPADGLIAVTPVFSASYSGLFKTFFDVLEGARWTASRSSWPPPPARPATRWCSSTRCVRCSLPARSRRTHRGLRRHRGLRHLGLDVRTAPRRGRTRRTDRGEHPAVAATTPPDRRRGVR